MSKPPLSTPIAADPSMAEAPSGKVTPTAPGEPLPRRAFTAKPIDGKPTDKLLTLEGGRGIHRERILRVDDRASGVRSEAADPAATAFTLAISHALANADGSIQVDKAGRPMIAPAHEISFTADALGRLEETGGLDAAIETARQEAAALADRAFLGMKAADRLAATFGHERKTS